MIYILLAYATRVIKPKGYEDLYLTQKCDKLTLAPANLPDFENQKVFIYNRMIYFDLNGKKYTLGMKSNDITVRLIENTIKKVSFISKKKMVDFFGLDKQESKPEVKENKVNNEYIDTNEKFRVGSSVPKNLNENFFKRRIPVNEEEKRKTVVKEEENIEKKEKLIPKKETHHFIESDSNLFEQEDLAVKNVQIDEKNSEYFQLKSENTCVTLFENKFIFAPCIKNASQYFSAVQIDEIIKKQEIKKDTNVNLPLKNISKPANILKENNKDTFLKQSSFNEKGMIKENELKEPKPFTSFSVVKEDSMLNDKKKDSLLLTSKNEDGNSPAELLDRLKHTLEETNLGDF